MKIRTWFPTKLSTQLIIIFVGLVILTAVMIGLPTIWLINRQADNQFWQQVEQGQKASQALLRAEGRGIDELAQLTAQRPTLQRLLLQNDLKTLQEYLETLRQGAGLDFLVICNPDNLVLVTSGIDSYVEFCDTTSSSRYLSLANEDQDSMVMFGMSEIENKTGDNSEILVGHFLDHDFAQKLRDQTGLEHTFLAVNRVVASSLNSSEPFTPSEEIATEPASTQQGYRFIAVQDGVTYYVARQRIENSALMNDVALSAEALVMTRKRLEWGWAAGMVIVVGLGSIVGLVLSRRIGMTFDNLAMAASAFQQGDLDTPVQIATDLDEATSVAQALESARQALNESLLNLRREKEWSDHLLDSIVEGIVILDQENRIRFFSPGAERISGWRREDVVMQPCDLFFHPLEVEGPISSLLPRAGSQTTLAVEMAEGRRSSLAFSAAEFTPAGSEVSQTLLLFRDVSAEQVIHRLMGHFMANISHEFRTPLSAIAASTELLIDQVEDLTIAELHELLSALHLGILKLSTLVDNLIESASIETGHFRVTPRQVDLGQVIGEAVETMQPLLDKYQQNLDIELPIAIPLVYADPRRTLQVLTNLLSNASKFGPVGSTIRIVTSVEDGLIRVEVQDRGPGVAQEYQDFIFRRFATVPQEVSQGGYGIGLGLSVVKAIVEAGGGEVGVSQNPLGGAIFWFTLPEVQKP
jgi:PAS domain S-box-containing protein